MRTYIDPVDMVLKVVYWVRNQFDIAFYKMRLMNGNATQFGRANRRKVARMREKHAPPTNTEQNAIINICSGIFYFIFLIWQTNEAVNK